MVTLTPDQFADRFATFTDSAFRLELLDHYVAANEAEPFRLFMAGAQPSQEWREPWKRFVRGKLARGASMARVHVITEPPAEYIRFELTCAYPASVDAGEDVRVLPREKAEALDLPDRDFWLLDSTLIGLMNYDTAGNWLSVDLTSDPDVVSQCIAARDLAMAHASSLTAYLAQHEHTLKEPGHGRPHRRAS